MFIQQAFKAKHEWWRYALGLFIVGVGVVVGQIPLTAALIMKLGIAGSTTLTEDNMYGVLDSNLFLFLMLLTFATGLAALLIVIRYVHEQPLIKATTARKKLDWGRFFFGFSLIAIFSLFAIGYDYFINPENYLNNFELVPFLILLAVAVVMVPLQTSFEEYLFRGYLMQGFGILAGNKWFPLLMTSVIFGSLHFFNPEVTKMGNIIMIYYIGTGFLLGIMTLMDDGMELSLGFHAGNNLVGALLLTSDWSAFQTNSVLKDISDPSAGMDTILPVVFIYPLFLYLMSRKYNWTNWRERLFGNVSPPEEINYHEEM